MSLPAPSGEAAFAGDDLTGFVNRTVTSAYATLLAGWLGLSAQEILGEKFALIPLLTW